MTFKTYFDDLDYLKNKYHKVDEPFNSLNYRAFSGWEYDSNTGMEVQDIRSDIEKMVSDMEGTPNSLIKARTFEYVLQNTMIDANEKDYFIGLHAWNRIMHKFTIGRWCKEITDKFLPDDKNKTWNTLQSSGAICSWMDFEHSVPDWEVLFSLGFEGVRKRAEEYKNYHIKNGGLNEEELAFFESIDIQYTAIIRFINRVAEYAKKLNHSKSQMIYTCLKNIAQNPPSDTYEVLQLIYVYFIIGDSVDCFQVRSLASGLDRMLYPYYKKDIESGKYTEDELDELIAHFLTQWASMDNYWGQPLYIGGTDVDGNTTVNPLSYKLIDIYDYINIFNPKIQVKVNHNTPEEFTEKVLSMIQKGKTSFVLMCEPGIYKAMRSLGVTHKEAVECDIKGCYEYSVKGKEVSTAPIHINLLKAIEFTLNSGKSLNDDVLRTFESKDTDNIFTFDEFYDIYKSQVKYVIEQTIGVAEEFEKYTAYGNPSPMYSATIESSLKSKKDAYAFGMKYNNSVVLMSGFASAIDSLCAIKYLIYDEKEITLTKFKDILSSDWKDEEHIRCKVMKNPQKFGNNQSFADALSRDLSEFVSGLINGKPNTRGGVWKAGMHSARQFIDLGQKTSATPDGRRAGEEISKNASPVIGMDKSGISSLINSVLCMKPSLYTEDFCLDVMLHPSAVSGKEGMEALKSVVKTYMLNDGISLHFNIFDAEILKDAQLHPENYKNLQVRVCGWNVLWNNMCKEEQDAYILRAENI